MIFSTRQTVSLTEGDFLGFEFREALTEGDFRNGDISLISNDIYSIYRSTAEAIHITVGSLQDMDIYTKNAIKLINNIPNENGIMAKVALMKDFNNAYLGVANVLKSYYYPLSPVVKTLNEYVVEVKKEHIIDFVNAIKWSDTYVPYYWAILCRDCGYDITGWNVKPIYLVEPFDIYSIDLLSPPLF